METSRIWKKKNGRTEMEGVDLEKNSRRNNESKTRKENFNVATESPRNQNNLEK